MKTKPPVAVSLLVFVIAVVGLLVVKEIRTSEGIASPLGTGLKAGTEPKGAPLLPYQLTSQSLVIVDYRDGRQVRWKNLEKVWTLLGSGKEFLPYVQEGVSSYLKGA